MLLTHSDITPPKANQFGLNQANSENIVGGWPLQILSTICAALRAGEPGEIFCRQVNNTTSLVSHRPNFTKFEHNTSIGVTMKTFGT